jgi:hypothetical protein
MRPIAAKHHGDLRQQRHLQHDRRTGAPTTLIGQKSTTTPNGRSAATEGYPLHVSELLATLRLRSTSSAWAWATTSRLRRQTRAIKRPWRIRCGLGFSLIEVLSPCPTIWKMSPVEAQHWVRDVMEKTFPLGVFCDRTKERAAAACRSPAPALDRDSGILGVATESLPEGNPLAQWRSGEPGPSRARGRLWRPGRSAAGRSAGRGRARCGP